MKTSVKKNLLIGLTVSCLLCLCACAKTGKQTAAETTAVRTAAQLPDIGVPTLPAGMTEPAASAAETAESSTVPAEAETTTTAAPETEAESLEESSEAATEEETEEETTEEETEEDSGEPEDWDEPVGDEPEEDWDSGNDDPGWYDDPDPVIYPEQMNLWDEVPWISGMRRWIPETVFTNADFGWSTVTSPYDADGDGIEDQRDILLSARAYVETEPYYDSSAYYRGGYPTDNRGVCCDVVAFALLDAGYNLRDLVNKAASMGMAGPYVSYDGNIDFRRTRVLYYFFEYNTDSLTTDPWDCEEWQPGDIVLWESVTKGLWPGHIGIISDRRASDGIPYVIHHTDNNGGLYEDDSILATNRRIVGHYRINGFRANPDLLEEPAPPTEPETSVEAETSSEAETSADESTEESSEENTTESEAVTESEAAEDSSEENDTAENTEQPGGEGQDSSESDSGEDLVDHSDEDNGTPAEGEPEQNTDASQSGENLTDPQNGGSN